ncbi:hypothetical protein ACFLYG_02480 [Chloroflexota bacterium]
MVRLWRQFVSSEKGQALPVVLAMLAIGGLTIAVSLNYATTNLNSSQILEEGVKGVYAAGAGVEHTMWYIGKYGSEPEAGTLPENINQMPVNIQSVEKGYFVLYLGELIQNDSNHVDWLSIDGDMEWDEGAEAYKYTITITWDADPGTPSIKLLEVGARIPIDYDYQAGSAALFAENLATDEPDKTQDEQEAWLLNWELGTPPPAITEDEPVKTQTFYITGTGSETGDYAWVAARSSDIGEVGEIAGTTYEITATATRPGDGKTTARITAEVMIGAEAIYILSWQISN